MKKILRVKIQIQNTNTKESRYKMKQYNYQSIKIWGYVGFAGRILSQFDVLAEFGYWLWSCFLVETLTGLLALVDGLARCSFLVECIIQEGHGLYWASGVDLKWSLHTRLLMGFGIGLNWFFEGFEGFGWYPLMMQFGLENLRLGRWCWLFGLFVAVELWWLVVEDVLAT